MNLVRIAAVAIATSLIVVGPASAGLINYSEASNGDLSNGNPLTTFTLDAAGVNIIAGNIGAFSPDKPCSDGYDCDSFGLTVGAGIRIVGISVTTDPQILLIWRIGTGLSDYSGTLIDTLTNSDSINLGALPLGPGDFNISWESYPLSTAGTAYTFSITTATTASVPEPGSLALLGLGLTGLAAMRRRKQ